MSLDTHLQELEGFRVTSVKPVGCRADGWQGPQVFADIELTRGNPTASSEIRHAELQFIMVPGVSVPVAFQCNFAGSRSGWFWRRELDHPTSGSPTIVRQFTRQVIELLAIRALENDAEIGADWLSAERTSRAGWDALRDADMLDM